MSDIITFVKSNTFNNVAVKKDSIIGFDQIGNEYRIFLNGGGYIDIRAGHYEYEQLIEAMEGENKKECSTCKSDNSHENCLGCIEYGHWELKGE